MAGKTLNKEYVMKPGQGLVLISEAEGADPFNPESIIPNDPTTWPAGWVSLGLTSKENKISFEKDGGEPETHDAWEMDAVLTEIGTVVSSFTIKVLEQNKEVFERLFFGGKYNEELGAWQYNEAQASEPRSVQVVFASGGRRGGLHWDQVAFSEGDVAELGDGLLEMSLKGTVQAPRTGKFKNTIFEVRQFKAKEE